MGCNQGKQTFKNRQYPQVVQVKEDQYALQSPCKLFYEHSTNISKFDCNSLNHQNYETPQHYHNQHSKSHYYHNHNQLEGIQDEEYCDEESIEEKCQAQQCHDIGCKINNLHRKQINEYQTKSQTHIVEHEEEIINRQGNRGYSVAHQNMRENNGVISEEYFYLPIKFQWKIENFKKKSAKNVDNDLFPSHDSIISKLNGERMSINLSSELLQKRQKKNKCKSKSQQFDKIIKPRPL